MAKGHPDSPLYPLHRVWEETDLVIEIESARMADEAVLFQSAVSSVVGGMFSGSSAGMDHFNAVIKRLRRDG